MKKMLMLVLVALIAVCSSAIPAFAQTNVAQSASPSATPSEPKKLTDQEIVERFKDKTFSSTNAQGQTYWMKLGSPGSSFVATSNLGRQHPSSDLVRDGGTWRVDKDRLCFKYETWQEGKEVCRWVGLLDGKYFFFTSREPIELK